MCIFGLGSISSTVCVLAFGAVVQVPKVPSCARKQANSKRKQRVHPEHHV